MSTFYFIRSVPLLVGVEAESENEAWELAGHRVDDFMTDAASTIPCVGHDEAESGYTLEYHGDAVYASQISPSPAK